MLLSWVCFTNNIEDGLANRVDWIKPAMPGKYYPAGFANRTNLLWSKYVAPNDARALDLTNGVLVCDGGNLAQTLLIPVILRTNNDLDMLGATNASGKLTNGTIIGSFWHPALEKKIPFNGAILQNQTVARGYFLGTNKSGQIKLQSQ